MKCKCEDDKGQVCNRPMSKEEYDQDGMCYVCADSLWTKVVHPLWNGEPTKEFIHETTVTSAAPQ